MNEIQKIEPTELFLEWWKSYPLEEEDYDEIGLIEKNLFFLIANHEGLNLITHTDLQEENILNYKKLFPKSNL